LGRGDDARKPRTECQNHPFQNAALQSECNLNINLTGFENLVGLRATLISTEGKTVKTFTISESETQLNVPFSLQILGLADIFINFNQSYGAFKKNISNYFFFMN
jgi:hypothetical protein